MRSVTCTSSSCIRPQSLLGHLFHPKTRHNPRSLRIQSGPPVASVADSSPDQVGYKHVMVAVLDSNPYLSEGSRLAVSTAVGFARQYSSKVTVLLVDEKGGAPKDPKVRFDTLSWHLRDAGCSEYELLEKEVESKSSVLIGDVADEVEADMVVVSADAVHSKRVDANLLAEFVSCPVMLLP